MRARLLLAACAAFLGACGQTGDLYLPESRQGAVITRPPPTPTSPDAVPNNSPGTVDSPSQPTTPAPEVTPPESEKKKNGTPPPKP